MIWKYDGFENKSKISYQRLKLAGAYFRDFRVCDILFFDIHLLQTIDMLSSIQSVLKRYVCFQSWIVYNSLVYYLMLKNDSHM